MLHLTIPNAEIAFPGAGTLAPLEVGASAALWPHVQPSALSGTSAGAAVAALSALGKTPVEMKEIVISADFNKLIPMRPWLAPFRQYLANNRNVIAWLREITDDLNMGDCEIPFTAITSDLNTGKARAWNSWSNPTMPLWEAVLTSMSIPQVFPTYQNRYEDGGLGCNIPVAYLPGRHKRIGFRVTERTPTGPVRGFIDKVQRELDMILAAGERDIVSWAKVERIPIIDLPGGSLGFLDTGMTKAQKVALFDAGYKAVKDFLTTQDGMAWLSLP